MLTSASRQTFADAVPDRWCLHRQPGLGLLHEADSIFNSMDKDHSGVLSFVEVCMELLCNRRL